jgi:hypothetical protein
MTSAQSSSREQDHGHFIVEGDEARRARGGMHGLAIRWRSRSTARSGAKVRSSAIAFFGLAARAEVTDAPAATAAPATWMARFGWRRAGGPLRVEEHPASAPRPKPT